MHRSNRLLALSGLGLLFTIPAWAACDLSQLVGYTLVEQKTIEKFMDDDDRKGRRVSQDGFEGCEYDRIIIFSDNTGMRFAGYGYQYAYSPTAYLFVLSSSIKTALMIPYMT